MSEGSGHELWCSAETPCCEDAGPYVSPPTIDVAAINEAVIAAGVSFPADIVERLEETMNRKERIPFDPDWPQLNRIRVDDGGLAAQVRQLTWYRRVEDPESDAEPTYVPDDRPTMLAGWALQVFTGSASPLYPERESDSASRKGRRPGVGASDSEPSVSSLLEAYLQDPTLPVTQEEAHLLLDEIVRLRAESQHQRNR